jgi:hypothetical protein
MSDVKVVAGLACLVLAVFLGLFAWVSFFWGPLWFKFVPVVSTVGLVATGLFLILKRSSALSKNAKRLMSIFVGVLVLGWIALDFHIRSERNTLQNRARVFLARPVPEMFKTDTIDGYQARPNDTVLSTSHRLIRRYAENGRIRWSAAIQGQFAVQPFETSACEEAAATNEAARLYIADCKAIIEEEWKMGFWHAVQDTIELKRTIPEIEEEDRVDRFIQKIDGTWTNGSGTMTISPNGTFSAVWSSQSQTNALKGTQVFRASDKVLMVYPDNPGGTSANGEKEFRILHVDEHNLVYAVDGQTNSMSR